MTEEVSLIDINRINEVKEHDEPFVTLSDVAMEEILKVISAQDKEGLFLRLYVQSAVGGMSFGMALDTRKSEDDHSCKVETVEVRIDRISFPYLTGANVDYLRSTEKTGFQINSPNTELIAASAGGCNSCSGDAGCC